MPPATPRWRAGWRLEQPLTQNVLLHPFLNEDNIFARILLAIVGQQLEYRSIVAGNRKKFGHIVSTKMALPDFALRKLALPWPTP